MLEAIIVVAIYSAIVEFILSPYRKKLENAQTTEEAVSIRKTVSVIRFLCLGLFLVLYLVAIPLWIASSNNVSFADYWFDKPYGSTPRLGVLIYCVWHALKGQKRGIGLSPISTKTIKEVPDNYILYLRGFDTDDYSPASYLKSDEKRIVESRLCEKIEEMPVIAVGMTKEMEAPIGCKRYYVDDVNWKEGVRTMMEKAAGIIILVNDRQSCIWEIEQSSDMKDKTLFLVDDTKKFAHAQEMLDGKFDFPKIEGVEGLGSFGFYHKDDGWHYHNFNDGKVNYDAIKVMLSRVVKFPVELSQVTIIAYWFFFISYVLLALMSGMTSFAVFTGSSAWLQIPLFLTGAGLAYGYWKMLHIEKAGLYMVFPLIVIQGLLTTWATHDPESLAYSAILLLVNVVLLFIPRRGVSGWQAFLSVYGKSGQETGKNQA